MNTSLKERPVKVRTTTRKPHPGTGDQALGWSRTLVARVMNCSDRALVNWEQGEPMSAIYAARLRELQTI